jgi:hypothetical protein
MNNQDECLQGRRFGRPLAKDQAPMTTPLPFLSLKAKSGKAKPTLRKLRNVTIYSIGDLKGLDKIREGSYPNHL